MPLFANAYCIMVKVCLTIGIIIFGSGENTVEPYPKCSGMGSDLGGLMNASVERSRLSRSFSRSLVSNSVFYDSPKAGPVEQAPVTTRTDLNPGIAVPTHDHNVEDACRLTSVLVLHAA